LDGFRGPLLSGINLFLDDHGSPKNARRQDSNNEEPTEGGWLWEKSESHCAAISEMQRVLSSWVPGDATSLSFKKMPVGHARYLSYFRYTALVAKTERRVCDLQPVCVRL
jgi:hypothetical protein